MKILVNCDRYPWPLDNGQNLRIRHYVRALRSRHQFDLVCWGEQSLPPELKEIFNRIEVLPKPAVQIASGFGDRLRDSLDFRRMIPACEAMRSALSERLSQGGHELLWMSGWDTVTSLPRALPCAWLADIVDDGLIDLDREIEHETHWLRKARLLKRRTQIFQLERHYFGAADACVVVSEVDAASLARACPATRIEALPNGVDAEFFRPGLAEEDANLLVFEGRMDFPPNIDAVRWFAGEVLPRVRQRAPQVRFAAVGSRPAPEVQALAGPGVEVTGWVDDVRPYLAQAALFVAPLRMGAGIKNKVLQAWSMGKAVVATPQAIGGLLAEPGLNLEIAHGAEAMAEAILALLADRKRRQRLGLAARQTIEAHYTWSRRAAALESLMQELVMARSARVAHA